MSDDAARALARNDRFLELIEELTICPFARATRTSGKLAREVIDDLGAAAIAACTRTFDAGDAQIVLLIAPGWRGDARAFERLVDDVRRAYEADGAPAFAMAPFHPDTPFATDAPSRLVGLFRRAPDPTLQLVRHSALQAARRHAPDGKFFFDGTAASWEKLAARPERGLSEQIGHDNFTRLRDRADELAARLAALRAS